MNRLFSMLLLSTLLLASCAPDKAPGDEGTTDGTTEATDGADEAKSEDDEAEDNADEPEETVDVSNFPAIGEPKGYTQIGSAKGDLDKDGVPERVIVYNTEKRGMAVAAGTGDEVAGGTDREIRIYKAGADSWELWHSSIGAVQPSEANGPEGGEPFASIAVERGALVIGHKAEADAQEGADVHRFRYQDGAFHLIGVTTSWYAPCMNEITFDYNLSTGRATYKYEEETCRPGTETPSGRTALIDEVFTNKIDQLPKMDGYRINRQTIMAPFDIIPDYEEREIYF